eukprot:910295-Pelagomonas_calceolata.AAC.3
MTGMAAIYCPHSGHRLFTFTSFNERGERSATLLIVEVKQCLKPQCLAKEVERSSLCPDLLLAVESWDLHKLGQTKNCEFNDSVHLPYNCSRN